MGHDVCVLKERFFLFFFDKNLGKSDWVGGGGVFTCRVRLSRGGSDGVNHFKTLGDLTKDDVIFW